MLSCKHAARRTRFNYAPMRDKQGAAAFGHGFHDLEPACRLLLSELGRRASKTHRSAPGSIPGVPRDLAFHFIILLRKHAGLLVHCKAHGDSGLESPRREG